MSWYSTSHVSGFLWFTGKKEIKQNEAWLPLFFAELCVVFKLFLQIGCPFLQSSLWRLSYFCRWVALFYVKLFVAFKLFLQMGCPLFAGLFVALKQFICRWVALFSAVLCVALMFMLTWTYAAATVVCQIVLGAYIYYRWIQYHAVDGQT